jgi:hypothetical protein
MRDLGVVSVKVLVQEDRRRRYARALGVLVEPFDFNTGRMCCRNGWLWLIPRCQKVLWEMNKSRIVTVPVGFAKEPTCYWRDNGNSCR